MNSPPDPFLARFPRQGDELTIGGRKVSDLVKEYPTPLYVYDQSVLRWRHGEIRRALPKELLITYAVKANPNRDMVRVLGGLYDGVDLASMGEMEIALAAGVPAGKMSFAGPGKSREELRFAVQQGIGTLSLESERELDHLESLCAEMETEARVMVRVNPDFEFSRSGLKMGGGSKQFGIDSERVPALLERLAASQRVRYQGIHIFSGTQNLNADAAVDAFAKILEYAAGLRAASGKPVAILNLGGGFGIPYFRGDQPIDLDKVGEGLKRLLEEYAPKLPGTRFKIELGRYLAGECGLYLASVLYRKVSRGATYLILNGGMHQHLAASGNISLSPIRRQMVLAAANRMGAPLEKVNVVGPLCTPLDTFGMNIELPTLGEGDIVAIPNSGAYGFSMSPIGFLSHRPPRELLL